MAMAQRRDRQKYNWGSDPNGTTWSNDESKFGFKLMQRMGWQTGSGLGKDQNGMTSHVKVKKKSAALGIGADANTDFNWLKTQDAFSEVLASLNDEINGSKTIEAQQGDPKGTSRQKYVNRRARMLYGRFKKSKDLDNYSSEDLSCVLGDSTQRPDRYKDPASIQSVEEEEEEKTEVDTVAGTKTISTGVSVSDYLAAKIAARRAASRAAAGNVESSKRKVQDDESEPKAKKSKSKSKSKSKEKEQPEETVVAPDTESKSEKKKKKKSKSKSKDKEASAGQEDAAPSTTNDSDKSVKKSKKKKSKKQKTKPITSSKR